MIHFNSVKRLYQLFPDATKAYPGHGKFTDIGAEKKNMKVINSIALLSCSVILK
jgi:hypothetical protein